MKAPEEELRFRKELNELKELLKKKEGELSGRAGYPQGAINNKRENIKELESLFAKSVKNSHAYRTFKERVKQIRQEIEAIKTDLSDDPWHNDI